MVQLLVTMRFRVGSWKKVADMRWQGRSQSQETDRPEARWITYVEVEVTKNADGNSTGEKDSESAAKILEDGGITEGV